MTMGRKPQQDRSARSMAKMLDAAEDIFAEGGDGALTVEAVVKRAGTSVGSFYSRFGDRDGLLQAMHERFLLRLGGAAHVAVAAAGNEKTLAGAIEVFLSHVFTATQEYRNSARFFVLHRSADPNLRAQGIRANAVFATIFNTLVLSHSEEIAHAHPAIAADVTWRLVYAALAQQMMFDDDEVSGAPMTIPALVHEITCCLAAYLTAGSGKR
jgi:AcrR family transcriptional regulator